MNRLAFSIFLQWTQEERILSLYFTEGYIEPSSIIGLTSETTKSKFTSNFLFTLFQPFHQLYHFFPLSNFSFCHFQRLGTLAIQFAIFPIITLSYMRRFFFCLRSNGKLSWKMHFWTSKRNYRIFYVPCTQTHLFAATINDQRRL